MYLPTPIRKLALTSPRPVRRLFGQRFLDGLVPEFLWLEATDACPNLCVFCDIGKQKPRSNPLSPEEIAQMLGDPIFDRLRVVIVSGGEPTLRTDLAKILSMVRRARPKVSMVLSSSAVLPERLVEATQSLLDQGGKLHVGVSLDGVGARHDELRGSPGLFAKVDRALSKLAELRDRHPGRLGVSIGFVFSDTTLTDTTAVRDYAESRGFDFNVQWYNQGAYYGNEGRDMLSRKDALLGIARTFPPSPLNFWGCRVLEGRPVDYRCTLMHNACLVKSNGDMVACFKHWNDTAGNIRRSTPSAVWKSQAASEARTKVRACRGCLNTCGVGWSLDANYVARVGFALRRLVGHR